MSMLYSGIYCIENIIDKKIYIGQSINVNKRIANHFSLLKNKKHPNIHLQNAYNKYGAENFVSKILIYCEPFELTKYEQFFVDFYGFKKLYNICLDCVESKKGVLVSEKTKRLMSNNHADFSGKNNPNFGRDFTGENNPRTFLTWENIRWIRENKTKYTYKELAKMFGVSCSAIKDIYLNRTWRDPFYTPKFVHADCAGEKNGNSTLTSENVMWIRKHRKEYTLQQLSKMFFVSPNTISRICLNQTWKNKEDNN